MGGHHMESPEAIPHTDQDLASLKANQIPIGLRDNCAHLLVGLNKCRRQTFFNPGNCTHQRHTYEECQYIAWQGRVVAKKKQAAVAAKTAVELV
jgi:hypothetical protein